MGLGKIIDSSTGDNGEPSVKVEIYKNDNATAKIFNPSGVDARPLDNDFCFTQDSEDTEGGKDVLGFIDPKNTPVSGKGEHRLYAREENGDIVASIFLRKDGKIQIDCDTDLVVNASGVIELNGNVDFAVRFLELETAFNQLKDDQDAILDLLQTWTFVAQDGGAALQTAANLLLPSTADIAPAKVDNVKLP